MKTLIIYDNQGTIFIQISGTYEVPQGGIQYLEIDSSVHEGKIIKSVNPDTKELVLEDIPKTELEKANDRIEALEKYIADKDKDSLE